MNGALSNCTLEQTARMAAVVQCKGDALRVLGPLTAAYDMHQMLGWCRTLRGGQRGGLLLLQHVWHHQACQFDGMRDCGTHSAVRMIEL